MNILRLLLQHYYHKLPNLWNNKITKVSTSPILLLASLCLQCKLCKIWNFENCFHQINFFIKSFLSECFMIKLTHLQTIDYNNFDFYILVSSKTWKHNTNKKCFPGVIKALWTALHTHSNQKNCQYLCRIKSLYL